MKLNNEGWGLRVELAFIIIFLLCLLIATLGLARFGVFGNNNFNNNSNFSYSELENRMNEAAKRYYQNTYGNGELSTISSYTLLSRGYISELLDENNRVCSGYTKVSKYNDTISFVSYINCPNYKTPGYVYE